MPGKLLLNFKRTDRTNIRPERTERVVGDYLMPFGWIGVLSGQKVAYDPSSNMLRVEADIRYPLFKPGYEERIIRGLVETFHLEHYPTPAA